MWFRVRFRADMREHLRHDTRIRRVLIAAGIYLAVVAVFFASTARERLIAHTPYNHFALLAEAWLDGNLHLSGAPPGYAKNNDFASYGGHWFVTFPGFPALLLVPVVKFAGSAEAVRDGQIFVWLAGVGPAVLFLALEKLRRSGHSQRSSTTNAALAILFAFGTVYYFSAVQGTVWFAAHVVGVGLSALYLLFTIDASRPALAGLMIAFGFWTRSPLLFAVPLFAFEALRVCTKRPEHALASQLSGWLKRGVEALIDGAQERPSPVDGRSRLAEGVGRWRDRLLGWWACVEKARLLKMYLAFSVPILGALGLAFLHNELRFGDPLDFGYKYLKVAWATRMEKWGLFHFHYLGRNLGVVFSGLPWPMASGAVPFKINTHGLALWFTTPIYLWLLWPRVKRAPHWALWLTVAAVAVPTLFYQNTGWAQFGYRFSNDYAIYLFALLAIGGRRFHFGFWTLAIWCVVVNTFGALTFERHEMRRFYHSDASQKVLHQPD